MEKARSKKNGKLLCALAEEKELRAGHRIERTLKLIVWLACFHFTFSVFTVITVQLLNAKKEVIQQRKRANHMQTSFKLYLWLIPMRPERRNVSCCFLRPSTEKRNQIKKKLISRTCCTEEELEEFHEAHFSPSHKSLSHHLRFLWRRDVKIMNLKMFLALSSCQFHHRHSCNRWNHKLNILFPLNTFLNRSE